MTQPTPCKACGHAPSEANQLAYLGRYEHLERCPCPCHDQADALVAAVRECVELHSNSTMLSDEIAWKMWQDVRAILATYPIPTAQPRPREGEKREDK